MFFSIDIDKRLSKLKKFGKNNRSGWSYWWNHWQAFNLVALKYNIWKPKYLFHDWEKPWLKMFTNDYKTLQKNHRKRSDHHVEYQHSLFRDYIGMIIDWECSRYTKLDAPLNARDTMEKYYPELKSILDYYLKNMGL